MTENSGGKVPKSSRTIAITIASIAVIFSLFVAALWRAGFFNFSGSDPSSKIVAAALALVGGLVAAVVSIIGILLKYSIDQRTEARLAIEAKRAAAERKIESDRENALQIQAEARLHLEAATRAVELLGGEGQGAAIQRAGALFALSNLNQHQLALDLTGYLLESGALESKIACSLLDRALNSGDADIQAQAAYLFYTKAEQLVDQSDVHMPTSVSDWDNCLNSVYVREWVILAAGKILLTRSLDVWKNQYPTSAASIIATFALAWESESDKRLKNDIGAILAQVLPEFPEMEVIYHPKKLINTRQIKSSLSKTVPSTWGFTQTINRMKKWKSEFVTPPQLNRN